jgi:hypothetical protein
MNHTTVRPRHPLGIAASERSWLLALLSFGLVLTTAPTRAGDVTYNLISYPALQDGYTLSGTITTDGSIGTAETGANIISWNINIPGAAGFPLNPGDSSIDFNGDFITTASGLLELAAPTDPTARNSISFNSTVTFKASIAWSRYSPSFDFDLYTAGSENIAFWDAKAPVNDSVGGDPWIIASTVPEPGSLALAVLGSACIAVVQWTRRGRRVACGRPAQAPHS